MPSNSLPEADLNLPEMKTRSPSCPSEGVHIKLIRIKDKLSNMETEIDINQNADENLDAALTVSSPSSHEVQEKAGINNFESAAVTMSSLFAAVKEPLPKKLQAEDIKERAQQLIDSLNAKRNYDTKLIEEYRQALEAQVEKSVSTLEQHMFQMYQTQQGVIEGKLQELFASLERAAVSEAELDNFKQSLNMLYTEMQNIE